MTLGALVAAVTVFAEPAAADVAAAAEAFGNAQRAELARDYARAAEFYELADSLAPSSAALRSAAKTRFAAGDRVTAATLALSLQRRYASEPASADVAERILSETRGELLQIDVRCDRPCVVSAQGRAVGDTRALSHQFFVLPGALDVSASFERGVHAEQEVDGAAGEVVAVEIERPAVPDPAQAGLGASSDAQGRDARPPETNGRARLPPGYFVAGAVLTAGSGAALLWSGLDVLGRNDRYESDPTQSRYEAGRRAELRTNVLVATTAVLGVATVVVGVFTDWSRRGRRSSQTARWTGQGMEFRF